MFGIFGSSGCSKCCCGGIRMYLAVAAAAGLVLISVVTETDSTTASAAAAATGVLGEDSASAEIGKPAPDFTLTDQDGKQHSLRDYRGKIVVLEWFNPDCPYVKAAHTKGSLKNQGNRVSKDKNIVWLAINSGAPGQQGTGLEYNKKMREKYEMKYPILFDEPGEVGRAYGAKTTPHMFIIDKKGILRYRGAIDDDAFARKTVKGSEVVNYVDLALEALRDGTETVQSVTRPYGCGVKYVRKPSSGQGGQEGDGGGN